MRYNELKPAILKTVAGMTIDIVYCFKGGISKRAASFFEQLLENSMKFIYYNTGSKEAVMGRKNIISLLVAAILLVTTSIAVAGPWRGWRGSGGWGMASQYNRMYNPATVETMSGTVEAVEKITPMKGMYSGIHLMVKTGTETISVHLGPEWYIERLDTKIQKGDRIEVKGSRVTFAGKPAIIAAEVKKGGETLVLRDSTGIPAWAAWRR